MASFIKDMNRRGVQCTYKLRSNLNIWVHDKDFVIPRQLSHEYQIIHAKYINPFYNNQERK